MRRRADQSETRSVLALGVVFVPSGGSGASRVGRRVGALQPAAGCSVSIQCNYIVTCPWSWAYARPTEHKNYKI